jgi:hypothetical protein
VSIHTLRETHGLRGIAMRYEDGGKVQVYKIGDKEVRLGPTATHKEIVAAFKEPE